MASNPIADLRKRKKELEKNLRRLDKEVKADKKSLKEIEKFLAQAEEMAEKHALEMNKGGGPDGGSQPKRTGGARPAQVVATAKEILSTAEAPMTRGELYSVMKTKGVFIAGRNPLNILGTTLNRHKMIFTNVPGYGYWLRSRDYVVGGHIAGAKDRSGSLEDDSDESEAASLVH